MATKSWSEAESRPSTASSAVISLSDVMSEQMIAEELLGQQLSSNSCPQLKKNIKTTEEEVLCGGVEEAFEAFSPFSEGPDTSCDEILAQILQHELDKQHDKELAREERHVNHNSKVGLSLVNFRRNQSANALDSDSDQSEPEYETRDFDQFEKSARQRVHVGAKGFARDASGVIRTKHDLVESARKNALRAMDFELETGDGGGFDMQLNNHVFNALKVHSISSGKRMNRLHEKKEKSTAEKVLDEKSRILLFKMVNNGSLDQINGVVATGKESVVIHGLRRRESGEESPESVEEVAIKVFKTTLNEFRDRHKYIESDPVLHETARFTRQKPKLFIPLWAEKEMHNLNRMRRKGILCPEVVILRKHILVMSFIGRDGRPAPTLKEHQWEDENEVREAWLQCRQLMHALYNTCQLVHADLSEYNLLWHERRVHCIDVSQSVFNTHSMAFKFLFRDCANILKFFGKRCLSGLPTASQLFSEICGKSVDTSQELNSVDLLDKMENFEKSEELLKYDLRDDKTFEDMLEKSARERQNT